MRMRSSAGRASMLCGGAVLGLLAGSQASVAADNVSADVGVSYDSHFVSYGVDVWRGGSHFFGDRSTMFAWGDVAIKANDALAFTLTVWSDLNNNTRSGLGGEIQEVDFDPGFTYSVGRASFNFGYNAWSYAGDVEQSADLGVSFDDTGLIAPGFALHPKLLWHDRFSGNSGINQKLGSAIVASIGPGFALGDGVSLTIPAGIALFTTKDFQGGNQSGYGFSYFGGSLGFALPFVPSVYGNWSVNFDVVAYFTDKNAIPGNPAANFVTGSVGLKVAY